MTRNEAAKKKIIALKKKRRQDKIEGKVFDKASLEKTDLSQYLAWKYDFQHGRLSGDKLTRFKELEQKLKSEGKLK